MCEIQRSVETRACTLHSYFLQTAGGKKKNACVANCFELCLFEAVYDKWFCSSKRVLALYTATDETPLLLHRARFRARIFLFSKN